MDRSKAKKKNISLENNKIKSKRNPSDVENENGTSSSDDISPKTVETEGNDSNDCSSIRKEGVEVENRKEKKGTLDDNEDGLETEDVNSSSSSKIDVNEKAGKEKEEVEVVESITTKEKDEVRLNSVTENMLQKEGGNVINNIDKAGENSCDSLMAIVLNVSDNESENESNKIVTTADKGEGAVIEDAGDSSPLPELNEKSAKKRQDNLVSADEFDKHQDAPSSKKEGVEKPIDEDDNKELEKENTDVPSTVEEILDSSTEIEDEAMHSADKVNASSSVEEIVDSNSEIEDEVILEINPDSSCTKKVDREEAETEENKKSSSSAEIEEAKEKELEKEDKDGSNSSKDVEHKEKEICDDSSNFSKDEPEDSINKETITKKVVLTEISSSSEEETDKTKKVKAGTKQKNKTSEMNGNVEPKVELMDEDANENEKNKENVKSNEENELAKPAVPAIKVIRLVAIEKLMKPNLMVETNYMPKRNSRSNKSIIEISDSDDDEDVKPVPAITKKLSNDSIQIIEDDSDDSIKPIIKTTRQTSAKKIVDDNNDSSISSSKNGRSLKSKAKVDEAPTKHQTRSTRNKKDSDETKCAKAKSEEKLKKFNIVIAKLPENLENLIKEYNLKEVLDTRNKPIVTIKSTTNKFDSNVRRKASRRDSSENKKSVKDLKTKKKQAEANHKANLSDSEAESIKKKNSKANIPKNKNLPTCDSNSSEEEPLSKTAAKMDKKSEKTLQSESSKKKISAKISITDSESDDSSKESRAKSSDSDSEDDKNTEKSKRNRSDDSDKESKKSDDSEEEFFQPKKKRTRIKKNTSSSSSEYSDNSDSDSQKNKKKRKRINNSDEESGSDDDDDGTGSPNKGRKNIRKVLKKESLEESTKRAEREERDRKERIAERQKLYNQVYDEKPEELKELSQLVLDFDEETKEPLLEVDKKLVKKLKPHQANGVKFMWDACFESLKMMKKGTGSGCILAHCMGLGKSLQVVALTHTLLTNSRKTNVEKVLVVCPLSTVLNWMNEFKIWMKHCFKNNEIEIYEISKYKNNILRANKLMEWHNEGGVMIIGYDMFRNLTNETSGRIKKKVRESLQTSLIDPGPDLIVCDEGHLLKNEKTSLAKAMTRIRTLRRIILTGTPIQNNMKEYYCMVQFVKPKLLGTYQEYMNRFVNPITNGQYTDSTPYDIQIMRRRAHVLHKLLDGCVQRRDYAVLAPFLPPKLEFVVSIQLTPMQCTLYKHYMNALSRQRSEEGVQKKASVMFTDFQNLQRIWTHPRVLRYNSDKFELVQQKKRDLEYDDESEGSIKDFIDDEDSGESTPGSDSDSLSDGDSVKSDDKSKKKKSKTIVMGIRAPATRSTRNNPNIESTFEEPEKLRNENPTEWWMSLCPEDELDNLEHSAKLTVLFAILKECEAIGDKLLVFSQSLYSLDVIEHFLSLIDENTQENEPNPKLCGFSGSWALGLDYFRLDGSTSIENRNISCKSFNSEKNTRARLFLISTRAGGLGINLVAANRVVIFDVSWNPSHDIQSIFRIYRFGQNKPCYVYRLVAMGTMEEKIYERQVTKQAISKRVIDEQQIDRHYKENDLQELYRFELIPEEARPLPILPKDRLFAELLKMYDKLIYKYHEHDSLLENKEEETLNEDERKAAWEEFEQEKNRPPPQTNHGFNMGINTGLGMRGNNGPVTSNNIFGFRNDVLLKLLNLKARQDNPMFNEASINTMVPHLMQELCRQMKDGEFTLYNSLLLLFNQLQTPVMQNYAGLNINPYASMNMHPGNMQYGMPQNNAQFNALRYRQELTQQRYSELAAGSSMQQAQHRMMNENTPMEVVELD